MTNARGNRKPQRTAPKSASGPVKLALRENLKRRKLYRARDDFALAPSNADDVTPHDDGDEVPGE